MNTFAVRVKGKWHKIIAVQVNTISHFVMPESPEDIYFGPNPPTIEEITDKTEVYGGYTRSQLEAAFELVKPKGSWKNPIDALVEKDADLKAVESAIVFYCGSPSDYVTVKRKNREMVRVRAAGYYACIGA